MNDAAKLSDYLEDYVSSLMSTSDKISIDEYTNAPYGVDHMKWKDRTFAAKSQERLGSYFSYKMLEKKSSAGEQGVIETRAYKTAAIQNQTIEKNFPLQISGRETVKQKYDYDY